MSVVLEVKEVKKVYGVQNGENSTVALDSVSFNVEKGEFIGIMGPSGSGKTTLLNILSGIGKPSYGEVFIGGKNITSLDKNEMALFRRQHLGFVFQEFNLMDSLTLKENVMLPMILDKRDKAQMEAKSEEIMKLLGIEEIAGKYPYNISGGQQQRVAVSRALVNDPDIIFADEPTGNLDSKSSNAVMKCIEKMNQERESTILMVTHDAFAASFCKKIIFIKDGAISMEIVSSGVRKEFFDQILDCLAIIGGERNDL
ncbi:MULTISPECIES: ABC transporter ATP-binding protein [Paenibacillus]|uniref:ATP-binding cassette domain-containing protein n=1 Tax=Paenibacillus phytohabitans TaxID=2654978 RepID=A0ABX1YAJ6_9BACL|nr:MULTISPECIES: ABC transporter ATP-binding protein [unclassified Paenibacillus]AIQ30119.1 multidrug ABC transporter ATP-binding protein [Paenibacillus sp. FSL P4-0081]KHL97408.1 multidrug ABC transporter ATP-binding protein [Paenibacillus sp. IHB B 3415]NOU77439.1 ATP-binding cassette domain-containing protein [Paenibacillus phytohabitans]OMF31260.1 multidrug ABC transporter ATP-binding protein [Paenibacillus sp. FSL H8-0259]